jgi:hypothetical protein
MLSPRCEGVSVATGCFGVIVVVAIAAVPLLVTTNMGRG